MEVAPKYARWYGVFTDLNDMEMNVLIMPLIFIK